MSREYFLTSLPNPLPKQGPIYCLSVTICYPFLNSLHASTSFKMFLQYQRNWDSIHRTTNSCWLKCQNPLLIWFKWSGPLNSLSSPKSLLHSEKLVCVDLRPVLPLKEVGVNDNRRCPERLFENQSMNFTFLPHLRRASGFTNTSRVWTSALSKLALSPGIQTPREGNELRALTPSTTEKN